MSLTTALAERSSSKRLRHLQIDATTMFARSLRMMSRDPDELILALVLPIAIMLMFVYVFGGAMSVLSLIHI